MLLTVTENYGQLLLKILIIRRFNHILKRNCDCQIRLNYIERTSIIQYDVDIS